MTTDEKSMPLSTICACFAENKIWIYSDTLNALFSCAVNGGELTYVTYLGEKGLSQRSLFTSVAYYQGKLVFVPCYANHVCVYEINTGEVRRIAFSSQVISYNTMRYDRHLALFPAVYDRTAWYFDMAEEKINRVTLDFGIYDETFKQRGDCLLFSGSEMNEQYAVFCVYNTNLVGKFDWKSGEVYFYESQMPEPILMTFSMGNGKERIYLDVHGKSVYFQKDGGELKKEDLPVKRMFDVYGTGHDRGYSQMVTYGSDDIVLAPTYGNDVMIWHNNAWRRVSVPWKEFMMFGAAVEPFSAHIKTDDMVIFMPCQTDRMLYIWPKLGKIECVPLKIPLNLAQSILEMQWKDGAMDFLPLFHDREVPWDEFIDWPRFSSSKYKNAGYRIYKDIMGIYKN